MPTAPADPKSVELFYSYAHGDETLCRELQKHLTALKRAGLISDWYDRKIDPGSEWAPEIRAAMERAGLILLLISADFIASKYIFDHELPFALERHKLGLAKVIPVLLRPVEWHDLPFAALQMLPSKALPVTSWPNADQAFYDIARQLRELIYGERQSEQNKSNQPAVPATTTRERLLDAAIASTVVIDEPADVLALFRTSKSGGLRAILRLDRTYSPTSEDVKSQPLEIEFPRDPSGKVMPAALSLALVSPGFDPPSQKMQVRVPPLGDSAVFVFMLTPKREGVARLTMQVLADDTVLVNQLLVTKSVTPAFAEPALTYNVVTLPVTIGAPRQHLQEQRQQEQPVIRAGYNAQPQALPTLPYRMPAFDQSAESSAQPSGRPLPAAVQRPKRGLWIGVGSSAAAVALVSGMFFIRPGNLVTQSVVPTKTETPRTESLEVTLSQLREQANSIEESLKRKGLQHDLQVVLINERVKRNLQSADIAIRNRKVDDAKNYLHQTKSDLTTLQKMAKAQ